MTSTQTHRWQKANHLKSNRVHHDERLSNSLKEFDRVLQLFGPIAPYFQHPPGKAEMEEYFQDIAEIMQRELAAINQNPEGPQKNGRVGKSRNSCTDTSRSEHKSDNNRKDSRSASYRVNFSRTRLNGGGNNSVTASPMEVCGNTGSGNRVFGASGSRVRCSSIETIVIDD